MDDAEANADGNRSLAVPVLLRLAFLPLLLDLALAQASLFMTGATALQTSILHGICTVRPLTQSASRKRRRLRHQNNGLRDRWDLRGTVPVWPVGETKHFLCRSLSVASISSCERRRRECAEDYGCG
jgi:hypothetical protein